MPWLPCLVAKLSQICFKLFYLFLDFFVPGAPSCSTSQKLIGFGFSFVMKEPYIPSPELPLYNVNYVVHGESHSKIHIEIEGESASVMRNRCWVFLYIT